MARVLWLVALLVLALVREISATNIHVRVKHHHRKSPSRPKLLQLHARGRTAPEQDDDEEASPAPVSCPTADSPLAGVATPVLTTACPTTCSENNVCIYYPTAFDAYCATTARRTCYRGATCGFQCVPNADRYNGWLLSLYDDASVVDDVNNWNTVNNDIRSVAVNISLVSQWAGRLTLPNTTVLFFITGNEAANNFVDDPADPLYYQDALSLPKGAIIPFELPPTFFEDVQVVQYLRVENIKAPPVANASSLEFPMLKELYLRNTMLTTFPLANASLPALDALDLSVNNITEISGAALPDTLSLLNLSYNEISELKQDSLPESLLIVDLASNPITQIPKGTLPLGLQKLFLEGGSLTEIPADIAEMESLEKLFLDGNILKGIPEKALPPSNMSSLSLINCSLNAVPNVIKEMKNLAILYLGANDLRNEPDFSILPETMNELYIDYCQLQKFPTAIQKLPNLATLSLAGNPNAMADLTALPKSLQTLGLDDNGLKDVPAGIKDMGLTAISLTLNPLDQLSPGSMPVTLTAVAMASASFTEIKLGTLPESLIELYIQDSALQTPPEDIRALRSLAFLTISNCSLGTFDVANALPDLTQLDLKNNQIKRFTGRYPMLTFLDLRGNGLEAFNVTSAPMIQTLHLAENNLTAFPESIFDMSELLLLNLTKNPIRNFAPTVDQYALLSRITTIVLDQEMFKTDCDVADQMSLRGYTVCTPVSSNANNLQQTKHSTSKMSAGLVLLNVCLAAALTLLVVTAWRRRELQKKRLQDLDSKTKSLEKMQRHQSSATIWSDTILIQNRLDEDLVVRKRMLGSGMYGEVWLATYKNEKFALKQLKQSGETGGTIDRQLLTDFVEEIKLLSSLTHPCVVRFVGVVWTKESDIAMVTEYMAGGDLRSYLDENPKVDNGWTIQMVRVALNITEAIVYLHSLDPMVIHRDLKSRNVLLDTEMHAKLSDFGISRYKLDDETMTAAVGTVRWVAPEVLAGQRYDETVDIYSLGIILSEIDTHKLPFDDLTDESGLERLTDSAIAGLLLSGSLTSSFSDSCPSEIKSLAERCTAFDATQRPSGLQVAYELRQMLKNASSWVSSSGKFHSSRNVEDDDSSYAIISPKSKTETAGDTTDAASSAGGHVSV